MNRSLEYDWERRDEKERVDGNITKDRWKANQNLDLFDFEYFVSRKILCMHPFALKRWIVQAQNMIGKGTKRRGLMEISRRIVGKRTKVQISSISNTLFHEKFYVSVSYCVKTMKYESKLGIWLGEKRQKREGWWKYHGGSLEGERIGDKSRGK